MQYFKKIIRILIFPMIFVLILVSPIIFLILFNILLIIMVMYASYKITTTIWE